MSACSNHTAHDWRIKHAGGSLVRDVVDHCHVGSVHAAAGSAFPGNGTGNGPAGLMPSRVPQRSLCDQTARTTSSGTWGIHQPRIAGSSTTLTIQRERQGSTCMGRRMIHRPPGWPSSIHKGSFGAARMFRRTRQFPRHRYHRVYFRARCTSGPSSHPRWAALSREATECTSTGTPKYAATQQPSRSGSGKEHSQEKFAASSVSRTPTIT
jgi:hypothetical protein